MKTESSATVVVAAPAPSQVALARSAEAGACEAKPVSRGGWRWLPWVVPLVAVVAAGLLAWQVMAGRGPLIAIDFDRGEGLAAGDPVTFRGVRVGEVRAVTLSPDLTKVRVEARLRKDAAGLAVEGSQFWVVRPEISAARVSGLDALLGPRYVECLPGQGARATRFTGLASPPARTIATDGALLVVVETSDRASLSVDSPVTYRGVRVGAVKSMALSANARVVEVTLAIEPAYRHLVRVNSRFWNAGGFSVDWGLKGPSLRMPTIEAAIGGGVAFATPTKAGEPVVGGERFVLAREAEKEWLEWAPVLER
ncbi:MAG TPA: MlaD family protein [Phycisphaerales bacterium]|nr:MlaD family protein [Phycisphaerales bacterium]